MRHEKFDTTKKYIQMFGDDAIAVLRKEKMKFLESAGCANPHGMERPERDLNPCHGLDRPV